MTFLKNVVKLFCVIIVLKSAVFQQVQYRHGAEGACRISLLHQRAAIKLFSKTVAYEALAKADIPRHRARENL